MGTLSQIMSPDVVHKAPGNNQLAGEYKGQSEVFGMYGKLAELTNGTVAVEVLEVRAEGDDRVVARHRTTAERNGKKLDVNQTIVFTVTDGKVTRLEETSDDIAAEDEFWGQS